MEQTFGGLAQLELNVSGFITANIGISKTAPSSPLTTFLGHNQNEFQWGKTHYP
jgi:hypothetical protein